MRRLARSSGVSSACARSHALRFHLRAHSLADTSALISHLVRVQSSPSFGQVVQKLRTSYESTPLKLKLVDSYLTFVLLTGIAQFAYCAIVGTFPFNAFLAGFISTVASFVLGGL